MADQIALPEKDREDEQRLFAAIKRWLQGQSTWLLILDQIEDKGLIDRLVPIQGSGHVLLTTRKQATGTIASAIAILPMTIEDSSLFLLRRAKIIPIQAPLEQAPAEAVQQATAIAQKMDGLPLALDQVGAYLEETQCSLDSYLKLYQNEREILLKQRGRFAEYHPETVTITLTLAFEQIQHKQDVYIELLYLLAFLQPDDIPDEMLTQGARGLDEHLQKLVSHPLALNQALAELFNYSFIQRSAEAATLRMHRIVQAVLIDRLTIEQKQRRASQVVRMVERVFPEATFDNWAACERYLLQAQHCATLITEYQITLKEGAQLLQRLGAYSYQQASYTEAEGYITQALKIYEQRLDADGPDAAQALDTLARLYQKQAKYEHAEQLHQRALEIRKRTLGVNDTKTAETLHNLAVIYGSQGKYQQAEEFYLRVLEIEKHNANSERTETAKTLNNLGMIYYMQGKYEKSEETYQRALTIYQRTVADDHPDLAYTLNGLGSVYEEQGKYQQAEEFYQRTLAMRTKILGDKHPDTARSMNRLADLYETQGRYEQAEELYRGALAISEQVFGLEHPNIALFLNNLAFLANKQGRYQQAEEQYQRALNIYKRTRGDKHPAVATVLNNLGRVNRNLKNEKRAEEYLRSALDLREQVLGKEHPDTAQSISDLTELLIEQAKYEEAEQLRQRE